MELLKFISLNLKLSFFILQNDLFLHDLKGKVHQKMNIVIYSSSYVIANLFNFN